MYEIILTSFFIAFTILSVWRLYWGFLLVIFLLPLYIVRFSIWLIPSTLLEGMILVVAGVWFLKKGKEFLLQIKKGVQHHHTNILETLMVRASILFFIAAMISVFISPDTRAAFGIFRAYFFEPLLFFLVCISLVDTPKKLIGVYVAVIFSGLGIALVAVYQ